ncbi:acetyl-CoA carboxylase biotin carboxyl carrier protein subunit [bacterium LRH843]|nr:acetyl-CoA carboxylase biotin carboxyl carrier protein subunit [bacterium LRH843]
MSVVRVPITGSIWKILINVGDDVSAGDEVAILESMKMEIPIESEVDGKVTAILKNEGDFVEEGEVLLEIGS